MCFNFFRKDVIRSELQMNKSYPITMFFVVLIVYVLQSFVKQQSVEDD